MSGPMSPELQDKLRAALTRFPATWRRTTPDPERAPDRLRPEFADTLPPGVPGLGEIDNQSIGK